MKSLANSSLVMFAGTLTSRILGFVRSPLLLGAVIGINYPAANSFDIANRLPNLIYMVVIGGVVNAVLVPAIVRAAKESEDEGAQFINKLITLAVCAMAAITVVLTLAAPVIVKIFAATMDPKWYWLTVVLAYWCIPQIFFYGIYTVLGQVLNAREDFGPYTWAPVLNNLVAILGLLAMLYVFGPASSGSGLEVSAWTALRTTMLGGTATAGIAAQALVLLWPLKRLGIKLRPDFAWRGAGLSSAAKASWWMLLNMAASIVPTIMLTNVAADATDRALTEHLDLIKVAGNAAYSSAYTIYSLPTSLIVVSIVTAVFTRMSKSVVDKDYVAFRDYVSKTLRVVAFPMFLCTAGILVLAVPGVRILAATVSMREVVSIAQVLMAMSLGLVAVGADTVLLRVFYAFEDTRSLFFISLPFYLYSIIGFIACTLLPPVHVVIGIGLVMASSNLGSFLFTYWYLGRKMQKISSNNLAGAAVTKAYGRMIIITILTMLIGAAILRLYGPWFSPISVGKAGLELVTVGTAMVAFYLLIAKIFALPELNWFVNPILRRLKR